MFLQTVLKYVNSMISIFCWPRTKTVNILIILSTLLYIGDAASSVEFLKDKEYLGTVQDMHLNGDYCAVRFDGKILLHVLEGKDAIKIKLTHMFHILW